MKPLEIIEAHYDKDSKAYKILVQHSEHVMKKSLDIARKVPELSPNMDFIEEAAMLHDIGMIFTNAPQIGCTGTEPYIKHGYLGGELLREEGYPKHARVAERHTGTGLTAADIRSQGLPLPEKDYVPETVEEEIICFADKFFSKSNLNHERTIEEVREMLKKIGYDQVREFNAWCRKFREL